jgi:ATP adenylyltransferase
VTERLWAPWRLQYIQSGGSDECIFCAKPKGDDTENLIVHRGEHAYALLNLYPYANGHLMVAPYLHLGSTAEFTAEERAEMWELMDQSIAALTKAMSPEGFNTGINIGRVAGAGVVGHVHLHVVPRWTGDTNFMPVLADVRVMPEHLSRTLEQVRAAWPS